MSVKCNKIAPRALVASGVLAGTFLVSSALYAGGAVILVPAEDRDVPEGSQISKQRMKETGKMVTKYKQQMKKEKVQILPQKSTS